MYKDHTQYALELHEMGFTFEDFEKRWPTIAEGEYGQKVKRAMEILKDID